MITTILTELRSTTKTNEKKDILKKYKDNLVWREYINAVYNPRINYYISKIPEYNTTNDSVSIEESLTKLSSFSTRIVTGNAAIQLAKEILSESKEPKLIEHIIDRDLKAGVNSGLINDAYGDNCIPEEPYMGCRSFSEKAAKELFDKASKVVSQIKMDGKYNNAVIDNEDIVNKARSGEVQYIEGRFVEELKALPKNIVLNGELTIPGIDRLTANGIISSIISIGKKKSNNEDITKELSKFEKANKATMQEMSDKIVYTVWDVIPYSEYLEGCSTETYEIRLSKLKDIIKNCQLIQLVESVEVATYKEAVDLFQKSLERGEEGTVIKSLNECWKDGKHWFQLKMKIEMDLDLRIMGFAEGKKGTKYEGTLGAILVATEDGELSSACGSGFKEKDGLREEIWNNQDKYIGTIATVKCNGLSSNSSGGNSLYFPVFVCLRPDKHKANTFIECKEIEDMKKSLS